MELRRNNILYDISRSASGLLVHIYHNVNYAGIENIPSQGPALLAAKHQSMKDIIIEGALLSKAGRRGSWLMKSGLPMYLNYVGGIKIKRPRDLPKDRAKRRKEIDSARLYNQNSLAYMEWLYKQGEIIVVHPEGTREPGKMRALGRDLFEFTRNAEKEYSIKIPVIPIGIEYTGSIWSPRSKVYVRAGKPLDIASPDIEDRVKEEMARLSNISSQVNSRRI